MLHKTNHSKQLKTISIYLAHKLSGWLGDSSGLGKAYSSVCMLWIESVALLILAGLLYVSGTSAAITRLTLPTWSLTLQQVSPGFLTQWWWQGAHGLGLKWKTVTSIMLYWSKPVTRPTQILHLYSTPWWEKIHSHTARDVDRKAGEWFGTFHSQYTSMYKFAFSD